MLTGVTQISRDVPVDRLLSKRDQKWLASIFASTLVFFATGEAKGRSLQVGMCVTIDASGGRQIRAAVVEAGEAARLSQ